MKYVGGSPEELLVKLKRQKHRKYLDSNAILDVPDDYYEELIGKSGSKGIVDQTINKLMSKLREQKKTVRPVLLRAKEHRSKTTKKSKITLEKVGISGSLFYEMVAQLSPLQRLKMVVISSNITLVAIIIRLRDVY
jgi:hypothetical protein